MEIAPFTAEHLDAAAGLLEERHRRHREAEPLLPERLDFRAEVEALWDKEGASSAVTEDGFLLGTRLDDVWGPNTWVELAGHAVREAELVRDLYAFCAARWVEQGRTAHYVYVPASDTELVDAWFRLGFGAQHAFGIRELEAEPRVEVAGVPIEMSDAHAALARPPRLAHLGFAAVLPEARGSGAGLALTAASFAWAGERGYEAMVTDWRVTNLLSSRFWPKRGFRTTFLRLYRSIP